jgi:dihydrofolate reductase
VLAFFKDILMIISLIAAMDKNRLIGNHNQLPWHLPADLAHFKALTLNKPIIMGRKTYESIGKLLPQRRNIIISRQQLLIPGAEVFASVEQALDILSSEQEVIIIGGAMIFQQTLPLAQKMYLTIIEHVFTGDAFFPDWDKKAWREVSYEFHEPDEKNKYPYYFSQWQRD